MFVSHQSSRAPPYGTILAPVRAFASGFRVLWMLLGLRQPRCAREVFFWRQTKWQASKRDQRVYVLDMPTDHGCDCCLGALTLIPSAPLDAATTAFLPT